ncbi:HTH-type transcriptional regulator LrpC [Paraliobacillus ryukyuensis]|uniref:Lrp/AsnC family leucine-responsive transcriptional regulator n=1 Tax=Paraliobacillus ryukyuensis TaxID=200904 RepID=A0A366EEB1_9BACI|nr:Lrp/AsnC family transcriptional regulator [Paraliobacillus ryukyuensis]RBP00366.1 Lrp/AsnC family leucine-responsive transcriptional regulator [Paraliobacillus ryukyuensis]
MDELDQQLVSILQDNARITISDLSKKLALSRPSVKERMFRLQEKGIIEGYSAQVSLPAMGREILLIIQVSGLKVSPQEFEAFVQHKYDIIECHRVTGHVSYFLKAAVTGIERMRLLIDSLIPYGTINTSTVLTSPIVRRKIQP